MTIKDRVMSFFPEGTSAADVARYLGVEAPTLRHIFAGRKPSPLNLQKMAKRLNVDPQWIVTGEGHGKRVSQFEIPIVSISWDENGVSATDSDPFACVSIPRDRIKSLGLDSANLCAIIAMDRAMEPKIRIGDLMICDRSAAINDGVYMLRLGKQLFTRKIRVLPGRIVLEATDPDFSSFELDMNTDNDLELFCRVVGVQQWF